MSHITYTSSKRAMILLTPHAYCDILQQWPMVNRYGLSFVIVTSYDGADGGIRTRDECDSVDGNTPILGLAGPRP